MPTTTKPARVQLHISDDGDSWTTPLATFLRDNDEDVDTCERVRALGVGDEVVLGFGVTVRRAS